MPTLVHALKARNDHGETPRDLAERFHKENILAYIDSLEEEEDTLDEEETAGKGHLHILEWLINREADCNIANDAGETPKDVAKRFAQLAVVAYLKNKMGNDSDLEIDVKDETFFEHHERAYRKVEELQGLLEMALSNFKQLGGITPQERQTKLEEKRLKR
ncbi:hypothetical protein Chor_010443 [Crotalus horridus]